MKKIKQLISFFLVLGQFLIFFSVFAGSLVHVQDVVSTSVVNKPANHAITFFTASQIPPGGKIILIPEVGKFEIPYDLTFNDVDLAVSNSDEENYVDRSLSDFANMINDGMEVVTGINGNITITLNYASGIEPGKNIRILIGSNATFGSEGAKKIINPSELGSFRFNIETRDSDGDLIDRATTLISTTESVRMTAHQDKIRANGKPTKEDTLLAGTAITIMSLETNYKAWCRYIGTNSSDYESASTTQFSSMASSFTNSGEFYHSVFLSSLPPGMWHFYVRCIDLDGVVDVDNYLIEFRIAAAGSGTSGEGDNRVDSGDGSGNGSGDNTGSGSRPKGSGGGGGGGSGGGSGSGTGDLKPYPAPLSEPSVILKGWAYPGAKVTVLRDGKEEKVFNADSKSEFNYEIPSLTKGVYTFSVFGIDSENRKSDTYSTTAWVNEGTKTTVSQIYMAPTMSVLKNSVSSGESISFLGQGVSDSTIEIYLYLASKTNPTIDQMTKQETKVGSDGRWTLSFPTSGLAAGEYKAKGRGNLTSFGYSNYNSPINIGIGVAAGVDKNYKRADLNKDGKVNLLDFSILLYHWGTDHDIADLNSDKKVNLIDFSMMMFEWTG